MTTQEIPDRILPDTTYDRGIRPWVNNLNDRVAYQRSFTQGGPQEKRIAQAMLSQDPLTPRDEIKQNMTTRNYPSRVGYPIDELTINQILDNDFEIAATHVNDSAWNDFSDDNSEINSTDRPGGIFW